jgi:uncharacterized protein YprB with RNaseH-like and TPR domain
MDFQTNRFFFKYFFQIFKIVNTSKQLFISLIGLFLLGGKMKKLRVIGKRRFSKDFVYQPKYNIVIVDVETTGLSTQNDRIIEIAAIKMVDGVRVGIFSSLINPSMEIPENITKITNITQPMVLLFF